MPTTNKLSVSQWVVSIVKSDNSLCNAQGLATSVTLPELSKNFDTDARAGLPGIVSVPLQLTEQSMSISLKGISEEFFAELTNYVYTPIKLDLSAIGCDIYDSTEITIRCVVVGHLQNFLAFELPAQESATSEISVMVNKYELKIGDSTILYIPGEFIFKKDGVNLLDTTATSLGITPGTTTTLITI